MRHMIYKPSTTPWHSVFGDRLLNDFFVNRNVSGSCNDCYSVPINISENETGFTLTADIPGISKDDLDISIEKGTLTISGERKSHETDEGETYYRVERKSGYFKRSFKLGETVDDESIKANLQDGVLTVLMSKREKVIPKKISVN